MAIVVSDIGADAILKAYFNSYTPAGGGNLTLKLYSNDYTPVDTSTQSDFTEVTGGGYAAITLVSGMWTITPGNDPSDAVYAQQSFVFTGIIGGSGSVYGYFVVDADNTLIWAEKFAGSFTPTANGDQIDLTPKFQISKGTPS